MTHKTNRWQSALSKAVTDPEELIRLLELDSSILDQARAASRLFPLKVPHGFIKRMRKGDLSDPLLRQVLPLGLELEIHPGYTSDPLQEKTVNPIPGLLHKYHGRVLLTLTAACGVNCRYCFRRDFPYADNNPGTAGWSQALDYIANDPTICEVILSGGDPLVVSDALLQQFMQKISAIPHITRLRIHSRMPIVLPERITQTLVTLLTETRLQVVMVTHCNHPQELDASVTEAITRLKTAGMTLLNQSVLLKDINDNVDVLTNLSERLFQIGILPYYLHILDKVQGAAHFDLDITIATALHTGMLKRLSGYLVPKLVREQPGAPSKLGIAPFEFYTG